MPIKSKTLAVAAFLIIVLLELSGISVVKLVQANPLAPSGLYCNITVQSPQNGTHQIQPVMVNFTADSNARLHLSGSFFYVLDGQDKQLGVNITDTQYLGLYDHEHHFSGQANLTILPDGSRNVTVYWGVLLDGVIYNTDIESYSATAAFNIGNTTTSPSTETSPTLLPSPTIPEFTPAGILILATVACLFAVTVKKRLKNK